MPSAFLPKNFDPNKNIVLIAGSGLYPRLMAENIIKNKLNLYLIGFEEETEEDLIARFPESSRIIIKVGQVGKMLKAIESFRAAYVVMVGQITPKKLFKGMQPDLKALMLLASLKKRNAETIFGTIAKEIEKIGVSVLDARVFMDEHITSKGILVKGRLKNPKDTLDYGLPIAKEIARLDIGQGIVVNQGTVLAVEAFEGTNEMLKRAGQFKTHNAVFIKTSKPNQDYRFDIPVFGETTLKILAESGLACAALESDSTLILNKELVLSQAKYMGITIVGY